jgi:DNA-binding winged helix-turn-helix (wHTH) protein
MTSEHAQHPHLLFSLSTDPETTWTSAALTANPIRLGRPDPSDAGPDYLDLPLDSVSRRHARIWHEADDIYVLENWQGRYGIGLFERDLHPGERHPLQHGYVFRIPALDQYVRVMFVRSSRETQLWPLYIEPALQRVYVLGQQITLAPQEYALLEYLYYQRNSTCTYAQIMEHLWPGLRAKGTVTKDRNLDVLLAKLRKALAAASGGFTFLQTVRGVGIRLVV